MIATQNNLEEEIDFVPTLMSRSYPFVLDCILSGIGVGLVPDYVILPHLQAGNVVKILPEYHFGINRNHIYMMYMPNRYQTRATTLFIDFLTDKMGLLPMVRKSSS